jgi:hypothetical protein
MRGMLSVDEPELHNTICDLAAYIRGDLAVPLYIYTKLEDFGIEIDKLVQELEKEIHGEGDFYDSHWGS